MTTQNDREILSDIERVSGLVSDMERRPCPECGGTGVDPMDRGERCIVCRGRG